jgi:hypothetical protein
MVGSVNNNGSVGIPETQVKSAGKTEPATAPAEKAPEIKTADTSLVTKYASGSSPTAVSFGDPPEPAEEKKSVNPLVGLAAAVLSIVGGMAGAADNPELDNAVNHTLDETNQFLMKHGTATDIDVVGNIKAKKSDTDLRLEQQKLQNNIPVERK